MDIFGSVTLVVTIVYQNGRKLMKHLTTVPAQGTMPKRNGGQDKHLAQDFYYITPIISHYRLL